MGRPRALVLRAAGVNCEVETAYAWELAGAHPEIEHVNRLRESPRRLFEYQILTIPGGFSYGDDIAAGKIVANQLDIFNGDQLHEFADGNRLILGICNGFQVLCKTGLLPGKSDGADLPSVTITVNVSGKYEDRWVVLQRCSKRCVFLSRQSRYELPVAHGEGRLVAGSEPDMCRLAEAGCLTLRYGSADGGRAEYPANPNGSMSDAAGLCDQSGRVFGLMPHPERFVHRTQHPEWTSRTTCEPDGLALFESAVAHFL